MNRFFFIPALYFIGLTLLARGNPVVMGRPFDWQCRTDFSLVSDSNVLESLDQPRSGQSARLLLDVQAKPRFSQKQDLSLEYLGGIEGFQQFGDENRAIQHGTLLYRYQPLEYIAIGTLIQTRWRSFFQVTRGYHWTSAEIFLRFYLPYGFRLKFHTSLSQINHARAAEFNYQSRNDGVTVSWFGSPRFQIFTRYHTELRKFDSAAYTLESSDTDDVVFLPKNEKHEDLQWKFAAGLEWLNWLLIRLEISFERQASNSYGYDFERPGIELMIVKSLPWHLVLRGYMHYQNKDYLDDLTALVQIHPDTETEESRYLLCDLIRDLTQKTSIRIRAGWYQNESPLRDLYYEKYLLSIGISQSF
jgi:hypothetical protein